jgi:PleD family two-component response regulator
VQVRYHLSGCSTVIDADVVPIRIELLPAYAVSLGLSELLGDAGQSADMEALNAEADAALFRAKQGGRNRVEI